MPAAARTKLMQNLVDKATVALGKKAWFRAEHALDRALAMSHGRRDYHGMAEIIALLAHARGGWRTQAFASRKATRIIDEEFPDTMLLEQGRYLVQPPLVGADARRLRLLAVASEVPAVVLCREPTTQLGLIPVVAIGPLGAIRTPVKPPRDPSRPPAAWFRDALLSLGEAATEKLNPAHVATRRLEAVLGLLDTLPEDDALHRRAIDICNEAASEEA